MLEGAELIRGLLLSNETGASSLYTIAQNSGRFDALSTDLGADGSDPTFLATAAWLIAKDIGEGAMPEEAEQISLEEVLSSIQNVIEESVEDDDDEDEGLEASG